jgi:hypothetical protein
MKTLEEILKQFDEMTPEDVPLPYIGRSCRAIEEWLQENSDKHLYENNVYNEPELDLSKYKVKSFLTQTYTSMVEAEVERLEDRLKLLEKAEMTGLRLPYENSPEIYGNRRVVAYVKGCKNVYEDQINYWKNKLK